MSLTSDKTFGKLGFTVNSFTEQQKKRFGKKKVSTVWPLHKIRNPFPIMRSRMKEPKPQTQMPNAGDAWSLAGEEEEVATRNCSQFLSLMRGK